MSVLDEFLISLQAAENAGLDKMLDLILAKARRHTASEAGSIFVVEENQLKACSMQNDRIQMDFDIFHIPLDKNSIAGYVAITGEVVDVPDLYTLDNELPYQFNRAFDDKARYRSTSMLAFPLKNFRGEVIGVVQLLNHIEILMIFLFQRMALILTIMLKRSKVWPFF